MRRASARWRTTTSTASATSPMWGGTISYTYEASGGFLTQVGAWPGPQLPLLLRQQLGEVFIRNATGTCDTGAAQVAFAYDARGRRTTWPMPSTRAIACARSATTAAPSRSTATTAMAVACGTTRRATVFSHYSLDGRLVMSADERVGGAVAEYIQLHGSLVAIRERDVVTDVYTTKYQHTDALGSPVVMTNQSRAVIERTQYEPYGKVVSGPTDDGPGYTGHVENAATGLTYMQQRYYDPQVGQFLSVDPVTAYEDSIVSFNRYRYANNNPFSFVDPDGRYSCTGEGCDQVHAAVNLMQSTLSGLKDK